jgi:hypothetical protein
MLATLLLGWCVGSFLVAPFIGRAIRAARRPEAEAFAVAAASQSLEVA